MELATEALGAEGGGVGTTLRVEDEAAAGAAVCKADRAATEGGRGEDGTWGPASVVPGSGREEVPPTCMLDGEAEEREEAVLLEVVATLLGRGDAGRAVGSCWPPIECKLLGPGP